MTPTLNEKIAAYVNGAEVLTCGNGPSGPCVTFRMPDGTQVELALMTVARAWKGQDHIGEPNEMVKPQIYQDKHEITAGIEAVNRAKEMLHNYVGDGFVGSKVANLLDHAIAAMQQFMGGPKSDNPVPPARMTTVGAPTTMGPGSSMAEPLDLPRGQEFDSPPGLTTNQASDASLLPCPFCGGEAHEVIGFDEPDQPSYVECKECAALTAPYYNGGHTKAWNHRAMKQQSGDVSEPWVKLFNSLRGSSSEIRLLPYDEFKACVEIVNSEMPGESIRPYASMRLHTLLEDKLKPVMGWHPLKTAPEAENILLFWPCGEKGNGGIECAVIFRDGDGLSYWTHGGPNAGGDWEPRNGELPTHWMPLPQPPASNAASTEKS